MRYYLERLHGSPLARGQSYHCGRCAVIDDGDPPFVEWFTFHDAVMGAKTGLYTANITMSVL